MRKRIREIHFRTYGLTDEGLVYRKKGKENQDSFIIHNGLGLLAIADGMGGYQGGR